MQRDFKGIWMPREIWCLNDLNITEKIVLSIVDMLSEKDEGCFANNEYFAKLLNLSKGRVSKIISGLVKKGYLQTNLCYCSELRKVEKRKIKVCMEDSQKGLQNEGLEAENDQGDSREQPYPLVANDQDIEYKYKINNISSSQIFEKSKIKDSGVKNKKTFESNSDPYLLAKFLEKNIAENNPKFPQNEQQRQRWAKDFDLMIRRDKIDADDIAQVIEWCQRDSFWRSNILSGKKVREKYQQLRMRMESR